LLIYQIWQGIELYLIVTTIIESGMTISKFRIDFFLQKEFFLSGFDMRIYKRKMAQRQENWIASLQTAKSL